MASVFEALIKIDVSDHAESKNGLTYLSWAWAWGELKKRYPNATSTVYAQPDGCIYWTDGKTAWVKTGVTVEGLEHIEYLPIMDYRNKSIPVEDITSMDANRAIQRSITKAIARHGLGLYIYAGEDLPEQPEMATEKEIKILQQLLADKGLRPTQTKALKNVKGWKYITAEQYAAAIEEVESMEG